MKIFDYALFFSANNVMIPHNLLLMASSETLLVVVVGGCNSSLEERVEEVWANHPNVSFVFPQDSNKYSFLELAKEIFISKEVLDNDNVIKNLEQTTYKVLR